MRETNFFSLYIFKAFFFLFQYINNILDRKPECEYGAWEEWSACSKTQGSGVKTRKRKTISTHCNRPTEIPDILEMEQQEICIERYRSTKNNYASALYRFIINGTPYI